MVLHTVVFVFVFVFVFVYIFVFVFDGILDLMGMSNGVEYSRDPLVVNNCQRCQKLSINVVWSFSENSSSSSREASLSRCK